MNILSKVSKASFTMHANLPKTLVEQTLQRSWPHAPLSSDAHQRSLLYLAFVEVMPELIFSMSCKESKPKNKQYHDTELPVTLLNMLNKCRVEMRANDSLHEITKHTTM